MRLFEPERRDKEILVSLDDAQRFLRELARMSGSPLVVTPAIVVQREKGVSVPFAILAPEILASMGHANVLDQESYVAALPESEQDRFRATFFAASAVIDSNRCFSSPYPSFDELLAAHAQTPFAQRWVELVRLHWKVDAQVFLQDALNQLFGVGREDIHGQILDLCAQAGISFDESAFLKIVHF